MTFRELVQANKDAIVRRWFKDALSSYSEEASAAFSRQQDPFANPIGRSLREGTLEIFEALLNGMDAEKIGRHLHGIIKIRAVQQFSASQAVGFVFHLKEAVRAELGKAIGDPQFSSELAEFDGHVDRIALAAFDVFVQCRERLCELRVNEVKRRVSWVMDKMNNRDFDHEIAPVQSEARTSHVASEPREGRR